MSRRRAQPETRLGVAVQAKRGAEAMRSVAALCGIPDSTLSRIERGTHRPTYDTAKALATWLGWTVDEVMTAAETPVGPEK
jgi:transcriptional regulator with XRE-family HTH domain